MSSINPRTVPIALVLGGAVIISTALYAYAFGQHIDSFLTTLVALVVLGGLTAILLGGYLYYWERDKYYYDIAHRP
jgi:hypothetical protein